VVQDVVILQNTYRGAYTRPVGVCTVLRNMAFSMAFVFMSTMQLQFLAQWFLACCGPNDFRSKLKFPEPQLLF